MDELTKAPHTTNRKENPKEMCTPRKLPFPFMRIVQQIGRESGGDCTLASEASHIITPPQTLDPSQSS
jgi:hypothetical protein